MATRAAMVYREAEIQKREAAAATALAEYFDVEMPPPFPPVRDPAYRAIDERERSVILMERLVAATTKENGNGPKNRPSQ